MGQFSGTHISRTAWLISFKFEMLGRVYGGHKHVNLIEISSVVTEIQGAENGKLAVL